MTTAGGGNFDQSENISNPYAGGQGMPHHCAGARGADMDMDMNNEGVTLRLQFPCDGRALHTPKRAELTGSHLYPQKIRKTSDAKGLCCNSKAASCAHRSRVNHCSNTSQLCAEERTECVLVVHEEKGLGSSFAAKDLAYR